MDRMNPDLLGAAVTVALYILAILVFVCRMGGRLRAEYWLGIAMFLLAGPLVWLLIQAPGYHRPALYYIQIGLMLAWLATELLLDHLLSIDFRRTKRMVIGYVVLFFAGTGGMLGVAAHAGRIWSIVSIVLFLIMAVLAFVQRKVTGK